MVVLDHDKNLKIPTVCVVSRMVGRACLLFLFLGHHIASGYVASSYYGDYESQTYGKTKVGKRSPSLSLERVTAVRDVMKQHGIDAFIIPTEDQHNSADTSVMDARREWLTGLSGTAGTALVTANHSLLWTDAIYFAQFEIQVDSDVWNLMRMGIDPPIEEWLSSVMPFDSVVGLDPMTCTHNVWNSLEYELQYANIRLEPVYNNIVDEARLNMDDPPPPRPNGPLLALSANFTGKISRDKISELVYQIRAKSASALILTSLDDIAYILNIRGSDIPYNPVFFSYLIIKVNSNVILFWGDGNLTSDITDHLQSEGTQLECRPYAEIFDFVRNMATELPWDSAVWISDDASQAIRLAAEVNGEVSIISTLTPVAVMKYIKNSVELQGFRSAHIKDGTAVVRFLRWVHEQVDAGVNVTEVNVVDKLHQLRGEEEYYKGPSFPTIAGTGANGAIIHYDPSPEGHQTVIGRNDMLLVDSGGQYMDGTTDITRTRHMGTLTNKQRQMFTRVLKGQILFGTSVFPRNIFARELEIFSRKSLWNVGLDFEHGTGHTVGHFLNVHGGPGNPEYDQRLIPGVVMSNEPGYYEVGEYGIRHEDIVEVIELTKESDHIYAEGLIGDFSGSKATAFYTISLAPHQTSSLDVNIMTHDEIKYLNNYHARVFATLGPILLQRNLTADYEWLEKECAPIQRSG